jgi:hypothetical protein
MQSLPLLPSGPGGIYDLSSRGTNAGTSGAFYRPGALSPRRSPPKNSQLAQQKSNSEQNRHSEREDDIQTEVGH